ncbi:MFS general substrate transporter [Cryphonectria parasitica EP155]|uniref:MFS general substrate transporter n=1 Tax=Cryphonectria parasitica (strain ATCC 38755 / EP155) TaxID=660469 RepID=A0A9P4XVI3_CRYP1|nr:MFS general substrate transporter [Cryphonectria parasitica EP155]KAF3761545.1 MFS general substrate transporter [Cryphonectria parasitica EP155]
MVFGFGKKSSSSQDAAVEPYQSSEVPIEDVQPMRKTLLPVFACGAGLFSDGYVNNVIGSVSTLLSLQYKDAYENSSAISNVTAIAFAGTVVGQLFFGILADKWSRINTLLVSTVILIIFTALAAGSYWHGQASGLLSILVAWRFFVGIGIGGEYPAGSVGCSESSAELKSGTRNRWFILFTNTAIDWGFVIGAFVPYVVAAACHEGHYETQWRTSLGIGVVFPLILFVLRLRIKEPEEFSRNSMAHVRIPYGLVFRFYGLRLLLVSAIWFIYDFSTYPFSIYGSSILANIYDTETAPLTTIFGWNTVINLFYIPGAVLGAYVSDWIGPRYALSLGVTLQAIVGFAMAGAYEKLAQPQNVAGFAVIYGIFLALGELGPGDNIGLLASKTSATGIRGMYYGIAAAIGKIGAFIGTYIFKYIEADGHTAAASAQYPFYVSSSLCILSAVLTLVFLPHIGQDTVQKEDARFRAYLESKGWDTRQLGLQKGASLEAVEGARAEDVVGDRKVDE